MLWFWQRMAGVLGQVIRSEASTVYHALTVTNARTKNVGQANAYNGGRKRIRTDYPTNTTDGQLSSNCVFNQKQRHTMVEQWYNDVKRIVQWTQRPWQTGHKSCDDNWHLTVLNSGWTRIVVYDTIAIMAGGD